MPSLTLTKHHGLGNDFLVRIDTDGAVPPSADLARALCHRTEGIGADGLITVTVASAGTGLQMDLRNADGSTAEMSGNGMRCLVQAAGLAGLVPPDGTLAVATLGGLRRCVVEQPTDARGRAWIRVDMGAARIDEDATPRVLPAGAGRGVAVDVGNPHLVLLVDDPAAVDLRAVGEPTGVNVEVIRVMGRDHIELRVWERGVGPTRACGTGSCAAAAAAARWGLVDDRVVVSNPGGDVDVVLAPDTVWLAGPAQYIGRIEVPCP